MIIVIEMIKAEKSAMLATLILSDVRGYLSVPDNFSNLIITSQLYANNYNYAESIRLEIPFI